MTEQPEPIVQITRYEVSVLPENDINRSVFTIYVENRGDDRWAVVRRRECMNAKGEWSYELRPSERDDEWLADHRFNRVTALELAKWAAPRIVANGHTAVDAYRRTHPA
ncbi:hypothetical protein LXH13_06280 [Streptomyces spinosirectus]|jgi:hypothetical protein|uniref:hypothetical protein n=1 Tax=Streptomyces TaxID=1883 RepID=UPI001C9DD9F1|nr:MULTISPECIES: hypothetical protein [Streptomyces]MBY8341985.1 hypothetical protein [Streptomyces plumbidurans]UIR16666.1 hypothetical protein LXH13_06280 [Streptomyces spinosirectus]